MKRRLLVLLTLIVLLVSASACGSSEDYSSYREVYNVDYRFYFYIPPQYEDSLTKLGSGESSEAMIVRFTKDAYALVNVNDLYDTLTFEETGGLLRENYTIGDPSLDDTYNDRVYMQAYFTEYLSNSGSYKDIARVKRITVNDHVFWFCHCYYYDSDPSTAGVTSNFNGEGYLYFTIYDGITYFVNVTSVDCFLSDTPEAQSFMSNFFIGIRTKPVIYVMWGVAGLLVLAALTAIFALFIQLNVEPAVIIEIIRKRLGELMRGSYRSVHDLDNDEGVIRMDRILGRTDYDVTEEELHNENIIRQNLMLDEILGRLEPLSASPSRDDGGEYPEKTVTVGNFADLSASAVLSGLEDIYLGRFNEKSTEEKLGITGMLDVILGRRRPDEPAPYVQAPAPSGIPIAMMRGLQNVAERSSENRIRREKASAAREAERAVRSAEKAEQKAAAAAAKEEARYAGLYARLESEYVSSAFATRVLDIIDAPCCSEEILHNLDTIFGRTLTSKMDNILERNVYISRPIYFGSYEEQLAMRQKAVAEASETRRQLEHRYASRIAPRGGFRSPYMRGQISSPAQCESNRALERILEGIYDRADDGQIMPYTERSFTGPRGYAFYVRTESALQNFGSSVAGIFRKEKSPVLREEPSDEPATDLPAAEEIVLQPEEENPGQELFTGAEEISEAQEPEEIREDTEELSVITDDTDSDVAEAAESTGETEEACEEDIPEDAAYVRPPEEDVFSEDVPQTPETAEETAEETDEALIPETDEETAEGHEDAEEVPAGEESPAEQPEEKRATPGFFSGLIDRFSKALAPAEKKEAPPAEEEHTPVEEMTVSEQEAPPGVAPDTASFPDTVLQGDYAVRESEPPVVEFRWEETCDEEEKGPGAPGDIFPAADRGQESSGTSAPPEKEESFPAPEEKEDTEDDMDAFFSFVKNKKN